MPYVTVHVDLDDFDDDDIREEAVSRGLMDENENEIDETIREMFYAFKLGRNDRAMELAREIAQDATGMILP